MLDKHTAQLAALVAKQKAIEAEIVELKLKLIDEMKASDIASYKTDYGTFTMGQRKTYLYTDDVKKLEDAVKIKKVEEEEKGLAQVKVSEFISVRV